MVPWGPDDWDAWSSREAETEARPSHQLEAVRSTLAKIPHRGRKKVADLGCGTGTLLPFLASKFGSVIAVDYAPASLATARRHCGDPNVTFRRRDLRDLRPFRGAFHVAVAIDSIVGPRSTDVDRVLQQVHRSLVEGGILMATFPAIARNGVPSPRWLIRDGATAPIVGPLCFHETELQYRFRRVGFQGIRIRRFDRDPDAAPTLLGLAVRRAFN